MIYFNGVLITVENLLKFYSSESGKPVQISMRVGDDGKMTDKKDDIHVGVEDEHGKEGEVEIDAPEEDYEEPGMIKHRAIRLSFG